MSNLTLIIISQWGLLHRLEKQKVAQLLSSPYKMVGSIHDYLLALKKPGGRGIKFAVFMLIQQLLPEIYREQFLRFIFDEK